MLSKIKKWFEPKPIKKDDFTLLYEEIKEDLDADADMRITLEKLKMLSNCFMYTVGEGRKVQELQSLIRIKNLKQESK